MTDAAMINAMRRVVEAARKWASYPETNSLRERLALSLLLLEVRDLEHLERARAVYFGGADTREPQFDSNQRENPDDRRSNRE